jgi:hypothetical protein
MCTESKVTFLSSSSLPSLPPLDEAAEAAEAATEVEVAPALVVVAFARPPLKSTIGGPFDSFKATRPRYV